MFGTKRVLAAGAVVVFALMSGCNNTVDDPSGPDVVLEVDNPIIPPITATANTTPPPACTFTLTNATASFKNKAKNSLGGTSPFNDIVLETVTVTYVWDDALGVSGPTVFGVGGSVPANGQSTAQFAVVNLFDLNGREGHTAALTLVFHGHTVAGDAVSSSTGGTLSVASCS
jgi:hypothetical protein